MSSTLTPPDPIPPPSQGQIVVNGSLVTLAIAAIGWIGMRIYELFKDWQNRTAKTLDKKDESESLHIATFIDYTLNQNKELVAGYRDGITVALKDVASKLQGNMQSQASMHLAYIEEIGKVRQEIQALHKRLDELTECKES